MYSICLPGRDWEPGERAVDQLSDSIRESERVMAVITDSFIRDPWCVLQFTLAMRERLNQPVSGLIGETVENIMTPPKKKSVPKQY